MKEGIHLERGERRREGSETAGLVPLHLVAAPLSPSVLEEDETLILLHREELWPRGSGVTVNTESVVDPISKLFFYR